MKKLLIAIVALSIGIAGQAQLRTSRTFVKTKSQRAEWILRVGASFNSMPGLDFEHPSEDVKVGGKTGFVVDFGFNKYFKESKLYWGMDLGVGTRGASFNLPDSRYKDEHCKTGVTKYDVKFSPFIIGYKFSMGEKLQIDPHLGAYISYDFAESLSGTDESYYDPDAENIFDYGIQVGAGVWFDRFNLDLTYQRGFASNSISFYPSNAAWADGGKTSNLLLRLGVRF